jgi:hypothetical protein
MVLQSGEFLLDNVFLKVVYTLRADLYFLRHAERRVVVFFCFGRLEFPYAIGIEGGSFVIL